jgi:ankyrin repeat protein
MSTSDEQIVDLFSYARHNRLPKLRRLLDDGMDVETKDYAGNTILIVACQNGLRNVLKAALRRGANINIQNDKGNTALHFCYAYGYAAQLSE